MWLGLANGSKRLVGVFPLADDRQIRLAVDQLGQSLADNRVVVYEKDFLFACAPDRKTWRGRFSWG